MSVRMYLTYHSGGGVDHLHLLEDGRAVVRDEHFALRRLDLFTQ